MVHYSRQRHWRPTQFNHFKNKELADDLRNDKTAREAQEWENEDK
jgi:hypothetical protein